MGGIEKADDVKALPLCAPIGPPYLGGRAAKIARAATAGVVDADSIVTDAL